MFGIIALSTSLLVAQLTQPTMPPLSGTCTGFTSNSALCGGTQYVTFSPATGANASSGVGLTSGSGPNKNYLPYDKITVGPNGQPCIGTGYYEEGAAYPRPVQGPSLVDEAPGNYSSLYSTAPPCPSQEAPPGQPRPVVTPAMLARQYWETVQLPKPHPEIDPGRAITGKPAYLETHGRISETYTSGTIFGLLEIVASGSYEIDWGDGQRSGPHRFEGEPWPEGRITHEYQTVGHYDVIVTEKWTATWRMGSNSGILRELSTEGRIDDFVVQQIQAVVGR